MTILEILFGGALILAIYQIFPQRMYCYIYYAALHVMSLISQEFGFFKYWLHKARFCVIPTDLY